MSEVDELCVDLMRKLKAHKEQTGTDPWKAKTPTIVNVDTAAIPEGGDLQNMLDALDDMVDTLSGGATTVAGPAQQKSSERVDQDALECLVRLATQQIRQQGIQCLIPDTAAGERSCTATANTNTPIEVSDDIAEQLDALGDLL
eukprot:Rhum_TRINITY_DN15860_c0_g1::Rhum_TRINITY_DN15860_c0_g1_i1::g.162299::m.162299